MIDCWHTLNLRYLEAEFTRIDLLLRREVRRWVLAGQDPNDDYRGLYVTQSEAEQLLERPFGVSWGQWIDLPLAEKATFAQALAQAQQQTEAVIAQMAAQGQTPRLLQLVTAFDLDRTALDLLLLCLAPALDTKYERLYGYLQDNVMRRRPTVRLLLDLLGEPGVGKFTLTTYLAPDAPLFQHRLLEYVTEAPPNHAHWINQTVQVDEGVVAWLLGQYQPHNDLQGHVVFTRPEACELDRLLVGNTIVQRIQVATELFQNDSQSSNHPIFVFGGMDGTAQDAAARWLAVQAKQPLLTVSLEQVISESGSALPAVRLALREARLTGAFPYLCGWDACLSQGETVAPALLGMITNHPGLVILAGRNRWQPSGVNRQRPIFQIDFGMPGYEQRLALWHYFVQADKALNNVARPHRHRHEPFQSGATALDLFDLANQFGLTSGQISDAVLMAYDEVAQIGRTVTMDDFFAAARASSNPRLAKLAQKIEPRHNWADLILPADQIALLQEMVATVRGRTKVLEEWGAGKKLAASAGINVLFAGPPGTGKTMAAEVIAGELRLDLYKIDLSTVVSKYIGETEKNLERIFSEASSSNTILFFDEADAIFGKRSEVKDAHDRYANQEISYLLQRMEAYNGIAILATNLRANLDEAFVRRLHFIVPFPTPQSGERRRIWETLFPREMPRAADIDFDKLAQHYELTGGNIRNVIYSAAHLAASNGQVVTMAHLLHGVKRELQKMGRLMADREFGA